MGGGLGLWLRGQGDGGRVEAALGRSGGGTRFCRLDHGGRPNGMEAQGRDVRGLWAAEFITRQSQTEGT